MSGKRDRVVAYYYDDEIGNFCYGGGNPMRPHRARMVYSLLNNYGVTKQLILNRPVARTFEQLTEFHADDYIQFLKSVTINSVEENLTQLRRFNMGQPGEADCPVFDGLYEYCSTYAGGSVNAAAGMCRGDWDIAFNWSGGMHHAKKAEASGFCYVNDIVLAILELLKQFERVLYVDIDIHHGDGVEEAFYLTDRVMTVSFHKFGEFFPGTGALDDVGYGKGKYYCVNVPLKEGMDDESYKYVYEPIMSKVMEMFQPGAIVMCCGADSLSGDRLGCFNLSMQGHSNCLEFLSRYNVPMLITGGGGYTLRNVARCWCFETGRLMGIDLPDPIPEGALNEHNFYLDTQRLRIAVSNMKNANTRDDLEDIKQRVLEHLASLPPVPSAQLAHVPGVARRPDMPEEEMDARGGGQAYEDKRRVRPGDESDEEEEGAGRRDMSYQQQGQGQGQAEAAPQSTAYGGMVFKAEQGSTAPASVATSEALNTRQPGAAAAKAEGTPPPPAGGGAATATMVGASLDNGRGPSTSAPSGAGAGSGSGSGVQVKQEATMVSPSIPSMAGSGSGGIFTGSGAGSGSGGSAGGQGAGAGHSGSGVVKAEGGAAPAGVSVIGPSSGNASPPKSEPGYSQGSGGKPSMVGPTYTEGGAPPAAPGSAGGNEGGIYRASS